MAYAFPVINQVETGHCIRNARVKAGLSVKDLQAYFGFEYPQAIYNWQKGVCLPSVDNLLALSRIFRVPMEDLLVYDDQEVLPVYGEKCAPPVTSVPDRETSAKLPNAFVIFSLFPARKIPILMKKAPFGLGPGRLFSIKHHCYLIFALSLYLIHLAKRTSLT